MYEGQRRPFKNGHNIKAINYATFIQYLQNQSTVAKMNVVFIKENIYIITVLRIGTSHK